MLLVIVLSLIILGTTGKMINTELASQWNQALLFPNNDKIAPVEYLLSPFYLLQFSLANLWTMKFAVTPQTVSDMILIGYQIGYILLIIVVPILGTAVAILILVIIFHSNDKRELVQEAKEEKTSPEEILLAEIKQNMNDIQEFLVKLHYDVKALKKFTGLITPKSAKQSVATKTHQTFLTVKNDDLDGILKKQEQLISDQNQSPGENILPKLSTEQEVVNRPVSLVEPKEYILPKREENFVNNFPTQEFLSTSLPQTEKKLSLSAIFDRKKVEKVLNELDENDNTGTVEIQEINFRDEVRTTEVVKEKVGFDLNNYNYNEKTEINDQTGEGLYQPGDMLFYQNEEYKIIQVVAKNIAKTGQFFELTLQSNKDGNIITIYRK
ncbi:hypothetical protein [Spiroplasma chrysopicola]|nr:hypothetical protein [Spiroplasma chrysopicola]